MCGALAALAERVARGRPQRAAGRAAALPGGELTADKAAAVIGALLPEGAIVSDEANTSGLVAPAATAGAPPHDWLTLTGGAIGQGLPVATGAAVACPDRSVLALDSDGSAMYTIQALWTQAREGLDVTTVIFSNRRYAILDLELQRVGAAAGGDAAAACSTCPAPTWTSALARGMGVPAVRAASAGEFADELRRALAEPGPHLIEALSASRGKPAGCAEPGRDRGPGPGLARGSLSRSSRGREEGRCDRNQV